MLYRREAFRPAIYAAFQPDNDPTDRIITQLQEKETRRHRIIGSL